MLKLARPACVHASSLWLLSQFQYLRGPSEAALKRVTPTPHVPSFPASQAQRASRKVSSSLLCWGRNLLLALAALETRTEGPQSTGCYTTPCVGLSPPTTHLALLSIPGKARRLSRGQGIAGPPCPGQDHGRAPYLTSTFMPMASSLVVCLQPFRECGNI